MPTEDKEPEIKEAFYEDLNSVYNRIPSNNVKIVLGDFNAKAGKEVIYRDITGNHSLQEHNNDNGNRLIDFAYEKNLVLKSTSFACKDIYKHMWISPDGLTSNQIDHVLIEKIHASDVLDVKSRRVVDCNSDHYLPYIRE